MKLTENQKLKIDTKVKVSKNELIVMVDVSEDKNTPPNENNYNIYRMNKNEEIVWQVKEIKTNVPFGYDMFVYLGINDRNEIIAYRFSGFEYKIDPETGEAEQIGFHK